MAKGNIPGIYNYCDRWCERCFFTSRCASFENENKADPAELDVKNKLFWDRLSQNFVKAQEMLEQAAEKHGINLNDLKMNMEDVERKEVELRARSSNHILIKLTREYTRFASQWLKTQPGMMQRLEKMKEDITLGVESQEEIKKQTTTIKDCLEIIQWYITFLEPKFMRALMGKENDLIDALMEEEDADFSRDYDGSAKIGVISVERCLQAWTRLFDLLPEQEDDFLKALSLLERIKKETLKEFPEAMKFVRPGFDELNEPT
jgi:hypothetical protein